MHYRQFSLNASSVAFYGLPKSECSLNYFNVALLLKCAILPYKCHSPLLQHVGEVELQAGNRAACVGLSIVMRVGFNVDARA